jgi:hypothetical protein
VTHNFSRALILAASFAAISMVPAAADTLNQYLNSTDTGSSGLTFTDEDKTITFEFYTDTVSCYDPVAAASVTCPTTAYSPTTPSAITVDPSSALSESGLHLPGFTLTGSFLAQSYEDAAGNWVDVTNDITLEYTVQATAGLISDLHLALGGEGLISTTPPTVPPEILVSESTSPNVGTLTVSDPGANQTYSLYLSPSQYTNELEVTKDITLQSGAGETAGLGWSAEFSALEQSFSEVPEPRAYAAVLGLFFALFFVIKRRRQQTA